MKTEILNLYNRNFTQKEISDDLSISITEVRKVLKEEGLDTRKFNRLNNSIKDNVTLFLNNGFSQKEISMILDVSIFTIRDIVKEYGLQNISKTYNKLEKENEVIKLFSEGFNKVEIAKKVHIETASVLKILNKNEILIDRDNIDNKVILLYTSGHNLNEIANYYRISYRRILKIIDNNTVLKTPIPSKLPNRSKKNIIRLYKKGKTIEEISNLLNLNIYLIEHDINKYLKAGE